MLGDCEERRQRLLGAARAEASEQLQGALARGAGPCPVAQAGQDVAQVPLDLALRIECRSLRRERAGRVQEAARFGEVVFRAGHRSL